MGAWGTGFFENDGALDWVATVERKRSWAGVVAALRAEPEDEAREVPLAAAALVAASLGRRGEDEVPEALDGFLRRAGTPGEEVVAAAVSAVDAVLGGSDALRELWADAESAEAWVGSIRDLRERLLGTVAPRPVEARRTGPLVDWAAPAVADWAATFALATEPSDWKVVGDALIDGDRAAMRKEPARSVALAAAEVVASVLGRPSPTTPPAVVEAAVRLGLPEMFVLGYASRRVTDVLLLEVKRHGAPSPDLVDLKARVCGVEAAAVEAAPDLVHPAAGWPELARALIPGRRRKEALQAGDVIGLHYPEGWVLGRAVPARMPSSSGRWVIVWCYEGFRRGPDDLAGATFDRLWAGPRYLRKDAFLDTRLQVLDPALRTIPDGAPAFVSGDPPPWATTTVPMTSGWNEHADDVGDLDDEIRARSGVGFREHVLAHVRHVAVHGERSRGPADGLAPWWVWRHHFYGVVEAEVVTALVREVVPEVGDPIAMRQAWLQDIARRPLPASRR